MASSSTNYAGFGVRLVAAIVDFVVYLVLAWVISMIFNILFGNQLSTAALQYQQQLLSGNYELSPQYTAELNQAVMITNIRSFVVWVVYTAMVVYLLVTKGQTPGKMALNLKVVNADNGKNVDWVRAILREVIGKLISAVVIFLGFFWMIWDPKKQAWHDKIANTYVVKLK